MGLVFAGCRPDVSSSREFNKTEVDENALILNVQLHECTDLSAVDPISGCDPYVVFKLNGQTFTSSHKTRTLNPKWDPSESFKFIIRNKETDRLIISVYDFNSLHKDIPIGDAVLRLKDSTSEIVKTNLKLLNPETGKTLGSIISLETNVSAKIDAFNELEQKVYEYQRWQAIIDWGSSFPGHLLPSDPGAWSTYDCKKFGENLSQIEPDIPNGYKEKISWSYFSTTSSSDGWQYAIDFNSTWYDAKNSITYVRRRLWRRICVEIN